ESRSPGYKTISNYLAKYLSKSFHLRSLYAQHGLKDNHKTYRFFKHLYQYEQRTAQLIGQQRLDTLTGQHLAKNQKVFRKFNYQTSQTSYFYRTQEKLVGKCANPVLIKKNYRLGTRSLNSLNLLNLATKDKKKELYQFKKPLKSTLQSDFQEFLITRLLLLCKKAEFLHIPLEQEQVPKEADQCSENIQHHFKTNPVLHFSFLPTQASLIRAFMTKLDDYAAEYDLEESKEFLTYPLAHNAQHETITKLGGLCGCDPTKVRNQYLDNWYLDYSANNTDYRKASF
ncbi:13790_t:CDS:1, partial [Funneliformis geosporum]